MAAWRAQIRTDQAKPHAAVITTAAPGRSEDLTRRQRNYLVAMTLRMVCLVGMIVVPGPGGIVLLAAALLLPAVAIFVANTVDRRVFQPDPIALGEPTHRNALPREPTVVVDGDCR